jgi:hypothetical protein
VKTHPGAATRTPGQTAGKTPGKAPGRTPGSASGEAWVTEVLDVTNALQAAGMLGKPSAGRLLH